MAGELMDSLRTRNISKIITERIASSILSGELCPGQRLPTEEEFAARIGAGKSSVREAIKILEAMGVVEIRRADGTYVVDEFKGGMLDTSIYGILLAEHCAADVVSFKVGIQRLAADDLLERGTAEGYGEMLDSIRIAEASGAEKLNDACLMAEAMLAGEVANPLIEELYRQAIRIAAHEQGQLMQRLVHERRAPMVGEWARAYLQELEAADQLEVEALLQQELEALMGAVS